MDDEATRLLREIRDLLVKDDARQEAWIREVRPAYSESRNAAQQSQIANQEARHAVKIQIWTLYLVGALIVVALGVLLYVYMHRVPTP
jgi:hypothetical protein